MRMIANKTFEDKLQLLIMFVRLAPTWTQLADKYASTEGVTIAKVDCTSGENKNKDLCNAQGEGFCD